MPSLRFRKVTEKVAEKVTEPDSSSQQKAVEIPVGAVLNAADRVAEAVKPYRTRAGREHQVKRYRDQVRAQVERELERAEKRGRETRIRVERQVRERERQVRERLSRTNAAENGQPTQAKATV